MVAVADDQEPQCRADTEQYEPFFATRMIGVVNQDGVVVEEHRLRFLERDAVLALVAGVLPLVPLKAQIGHTYCKYVVMEIK